MNVARKKIDCLSNIPNRNDKIAYPKAALGVPHCNRVANAAAFAVIRYEKTIKELAKV